DEKIDHIPILFISLNICISAAFPSFLDVRALLLSEINGFKLKAFTPNLNIGCHLGFTKGRILLWIFSCISGSIFIGGSPFLVISTASFYIKLTSPFPITRNL
ncbi:MAG: hypothetical protein U9O78_02610, partial [Patescibacteria group bacterium]|nr:hypothetical protein [Patescibacteria group bacterium]